jgi:hypothetical protein
MYSHCSGYRRIRDYFGTCAAPDWQYTDSAGRKALACLNFNGGGASGGPYGAGGMMTSGPIPGQNNCKNGGSPHIRQFGRLQSTYMTSKCCCRCCANDWCSFTYNDGISEHCYGIANTKENWSVVGSGWRWQKIDMAYACSSLHNTVCPIANWYG